MSVGRRDTPTRPTTVRVKFFAPKQVAVPETPLGTLHTYGRNHFGHSSTDLPVTPGRRPVMFPEEGPGRGLGPRHGTDGRRTGVRKEEETPGTVGSSDPTEKTDGRTRDKSEGCLWKS